MTRARVLEGTVLILRRTLRAPDLPISDATTANDVPGWDSLAHASVLIRLEKHFNVRLPETTAYDAKNVGALVDAIASLVGE